MTRGRWLFMGGFLLVSIAIIVLWKFLVPDAPFIEAAKWDETDRARDALVMYRQLSHGNIFYVPWAIYSAITWPALFQLLAQLPLLCFGLSVHSLTLVPFFAVALVPVVLGYGLWLLSRHVAWALTAFFLSAALLLAGRSFYPYWGILMLETLQILGWAIWSLTLLGCGAGPRRYKYFFSACWLVFFLKVPYFLFFLIPTLGLWLIRLWEQRASGLRLWKSFSTPAKAFFFLTLILVSHILICKLGWAGLVYRRPEWAGGRALRNPIAWAFASGLVFMLLAWNRLGAILTHGEFERGFITFFLLPSSIWMAVPWPNRWAVIVLTQNFGSSVSGLYARLVFYPRAMEAFFSGQHFLLGVYVLAAVVGIFASLARPTRPYVYLHFFICFQVFLLVFGGNNFQSRFCIHLIFMEAIVALAAAAKKFPSALMGFTALGLAIASFAVGVKTFNRATFEEALRGETLNYREYPGIFPLAKSFGALQSHPSGRSYVILDEKGFLTKTLMPFTEIEKIQGRDWNFSFAPDSPSACALARHIAGTTVIAPRPSGWERVICQI